MFVDYYTTETEDPDKRWATAKQHKNQAKPKYAQQYSHDLYYCRAPVMKCQH